MNYILNNVWEKWKKTKMFYCQWKAERLRKLSTSSLQSNEELKYRQVEDHNSIPIQEKPLLVVDLITFKQKDKDISEFKTDEQAKKKYKTNLNDSTPPRFSHVAKQITPLGILFLYKVRVRMSGNWTNK